MGRCVGITEECWASLSEDTKQNWRYFSAALRFIGANLVSRTGNPYVDIPLGALAVIAIALVIDPQRSYSRLSPTFRKRNVRITVALGVSSIAILGTFFFLQACLFSGVTVWTQHISPALRPEKHQLILVLNILAFTLAVPVAAAKVFRDLQLAEVLYRLPRRGLIKMFVHKELQAQSFAQFALIEATVLWACLVYVSTAADIAKTVLDIVRVFTL